MTRTHEGPADPEATLWTEVAHASPGDNRFRGYSVGRELVGVANTWSMLSLAVGYRLLTTDEVAILDDIAVCSCCADPRIWPLKVARLATAYGRPAAGLVAAILANDGSAVGWPAIRQAAEFLNHMAATVKSDRGRANLEAAVEAHAAAGAHGFPGFGVPFRDMDERLEFLRPIVERRGRAGRPMWSLALALERVLAPRKRPLNVAGGIAAILLDIGFSAPQLEMLPLGLMLSNYLANCVEGALQAPEILRCLPAHVIDDRSNAPRQSPRARTNTAPGMGTSPRISLDAGRRSRGRSTPE